VNLACDERNNINTVRLNLQLSIIALAYLEYQIYVGLQILTVAKVKMTDLCDIALCRVL
jgi:hypothetical protein